MKTALITGITGQDGAYLSKLLLDKGYNVVGIVRSYTNNYGNLKYLRIFDKIVLEECDLLDISNIIKVLNKHMPDEIYNLAAQSSVAMSFQQPIGTIQFNLISVLNILESIKLINAKIKFYQASSSDMYGKVVNLPILENEHFHPLSPYAISKASAHWAVINYRESFGIFGSCGILFNHESYLRSENFFIKKVIRDSIKIKKGELKELKVGNIEIKRDFGFAPKYVEAIYLMLQQDVPDDFIICSGKSVKLREVVEHIFKYIGIDTERIIVDSKLYRPLDIEDIYGDNKKAKNELNWKYEMTFFDVLDIILKEELENVGL